MGWLNELFGGGDAGDETANADSEVEPDSDGNESDEAPGEAIDPPDIYLAAVLYPFPVSFDGDELGALFEDAGLEVEQIEGGPNGVFRVTTANQTLLVDQNDKSFPRERMNRRLLPDGFPDDYSYIGVTAESVESNGTDGRDGSLEASDPWAEDGVIRSTTKVVRRLLAEDGLAVVLESAGQLAMPSQDFVETTAGVDDPEQRPFLGWVDIRYDDDGEYLRTEGLRLFGLPEVFVSGAHDDDQWRVQREQEALCFAASEMIHDNRVLGTSGEEDDPDFKAIDDFRVPFGVDVGSERVEVDDEVEFTSFNVEMDDDRLVMDANGPSSVWTTWASIDTEDTPIEISAYQALFRHGCRTALEPEAVGAMAVDHVDEMPALHYDVYQNDQSQPTLLVTNGLGRLARPADEVGSAHRRLELVVRTPELREEILNILSSTATGIELSDDLLDPPDTVEFEAPLHGLQYFVLSPMGEVRPTDDGPAVELWQMVPLFKDEYDAISEGDVEAWLAEHDNVQGREYSDRWQAVGR